MFWRGKNETVNLKTVLNLRDINVQSLTKSCVFNSFDCGKPLLTKFIKSKALASHKRGEFSVQVASKSGSHRCLGYYALQVGSDTVPENKIHKKSYLGPGNYTSFPAVELKYLAVDLEFQGKGLGRFLLMDALEKVLEISKLVGLYAITVQSLNQESTEFYLKQGFKVYVENGHQPKMMYTLGTIRKVITTVPLNS